MAGAAPSLSSIGGAILLDGNKQQATIIDVERQPRPVGDGTKGSGRRALTEEELARYAVVLRRRRQYMLSLLVMILLPIIALIFLIGPFLLTSWDLPSRIIWWFCGLILVIGFFRLIRYHDRSYGYHPEIPCFLPNPVPTIAEAADEV